MKNPPVLSSRGKGVTFLILAMLACTLVVAGVLHETGVSFASGLDHAPIPTHDTFFSIVELPKPIYTATPTNPSPQSAQLPIDTSIELTATTEPLAQAQIIADTPLPGGSDSSNAQVHPADPAYSGNKSILIDISEQHMYVYEGDNVVFSFIASTGMNNATRVGSFSVLDKISNAYGATWDLWMPNWLGIYYAGSLENGIHALPILSNGTQLWAGYLGTPISFGCIVLGVDDAQLLYDWADVGTPVNIQW